MSNRCTGHCCRDFTIPLSPKEVAALPARLDARGNVVRRADGTPVEYQDGKQIGDMLIYLGRYRYAKHQVRTAILKSTGRTKRRGLYHYTCKHLKDGNCSIYDSRPKMCREYPNGEPCAFSGCQWSKARAGHVVEHDEDKANDETAPSTPDQAHSKS